MSYRSFSFSFGINTAVCQDMLTAEEEKRKRRRSARTSSWTDQNTNLVTWGETIMAGKIQSVMLWARGQRSARMWTDLPPEWPRLCWAADFSHEPLIYRKTWKLTEKETQNTQGLDLKPSSIRTGAANWTQNRVQTSGPILKNRVETRKTPKTKRVYGRAPSLSAEKQSAFTRHKFLLSSVHLSDEDRLRLRPYWADWCRFTGFNTAAGGKNKKTNRGA